MASRITLPFWPSSLNNLSWSYTNLIAVGGGDQIAILSPRLQTPGPGGTHWNSALFRANAFTATESGPVQPLSFANWSLGEELSLRHVVSLEWSPVGKNGSGLGRFGHCVLGVLSSNHVLSIWECEGKPDGSGNWKRKIVVNHALQRYYEGLERLERETDQDYAERKQVAQRVRASAWGSFMMPRDDSQAELQVPFAIGGCQLLAAATEAGDIVFFRIRSPHDILNPARKQWEVEVIQSVSVHDMIRDTFAEDPGDAKSNPPAIADHIAWRPWDWDSNISHAHLAFIVSGRLYCLSIEVRSNHPEARTTLWHANTARRLIPSQSNMTGPLKCVPTTAFLISFASDAVYCIDIRVPDTSGTASHHLDGRWDEISGVTSTAISTKQDSREDDAKIHIASHLSTSTTPTTTFSLLPALCANSEPPAWQTAIQQSREAFSNQHKLDGHVLARTWGIAGSPSGEFVATAITLLPSDSVAHIIPSDMRTVVNITRDVAPEDDDEVLARFGGGVSSEVILFSLQRYLETRTSDVETLVKTMLSNTQPPRPTTWSEEELGSDSDQIIRHFRSQMLDNPEMKTARFNVLASLALEQKYIVDSTAIIKHLITTILSIIPHVNHSRPLSTRIKNIYTVLGSKLKPLQTNNDQTDTSESIETCRICNEEIEFESLNWARCIIGHQFSRCSLTFLAIQEPNITKACGVCGAKVLHEWKIPKLTSLAEPDGDVGMANGDAEAKSEPTTSLARILFTAFESCIYCGGKFVA